MSAHDKTPSSAEAATGLSPALEEEFFASVLDESADPRESLDAFCKRYPQHADEFRRITADMLFAAGNCDLVEQQAVSPPMPERIGPYRVIDKLGQGGFGVVWLAEQEQPLRRRVALKVLQASLQHSRVLQRFEQERDALAQMEHPGIAKIHDAGESEFGPYFAMEHVPGKSITAFCDAQRMPIDERITLFLEVCMAVQYAHQKSVVHRDLKPGNVLVCDAERPYAKVIDFGLAKVLDLSGETGITEEGKSVGTVEYMSPEQAAGEAVDTRTDIYSLGVVLYELLTGELPFDSRKLRSGGWARARSILLERDPLRPSQALERSASREKASADRSTAPDALVRRVSGELNWIVMKALAKNRDERYGTVDELAKDLARHLANEPVSVGPPGVGYVAAKFVRRHRAGVIAACSLALLFLIGLGGGVVAFIEIARHRQRAENEAVEARAKTYEASIAAAAAATASGDARAARAALEGAPEELRHWEWRHLKSHLGRPVLRAAGPGIELISDLVGLPGQRVVVSATDGQKNQLQLWNLADQSLTWSAPLPEEAKSLAVGPDNSSVVAGCVDGSILVVDVNSGRVRHSERHSRRFAAGALTRDSLIIVGDHKVNILRKGSWELRHAFATEVGDCDCLKVSQDGTWIACGGADGAALYRVGSGVDPDKWTVESTWVSKANVRHCALNIEAGRAMFVSHRDRSVVTVDLASGEVQKFPGRVPIATEVAISGRAKLIALGYRDGTIQLYDLDMNSVRQFRGHDVFVDGLAFSADGSELISADWAATIRRWNTTRTTQQSLFPDSTPVRCFASRQDGARVVVGTTEGSVECWDAGLRERVWAVSLSDQSIVSISYCRSGDRVLAADGGRTLWSLRASDGGDHRSVEGAGIWIASQVDSSCDAPIAITTRRRLAMVDPRTLEVLARTELPEDSIWDRLSQFGDRVAVIGQGVHIWSASTEAWKHDLEDERTTAVAFSPDGGVLAVGKWSGELVLLKTSDATQLAVIRAAGHRMHRAVAIAWSSDARRLAASLPDYSIRIHSVERGVELLALQDHADWADRVAFVGKPGAASLFATSRGKLFRWSAPPVLEAR